MKLNDIAAMMYVAYFAVFFILVIGNWLFTRKLSPKQMHYWAPRLRLLNIMVLGPFFVLLPLAWGGPLPALFVLMMLIIISYLIVTKVRVCKECGHVVQPDKLIFPAQFCPKCGAKLTAAKLFDVKNN